MLKYQTVCVVITLALSGCQSVSRYQIQKDTAPETHPTLDHIQPLQPKNEPLSRRGNSNYKLNGKHYQVNVAVNQFTEEGDASWYGRKFHGHETSNGEIYDMFQLSAAHKTLPLPSYVKVINQNNQKELIVRINDRGPFHDGRILDLSYAAARKLGVYETGTAPIKIELIHPEQLESESRDYQDIYVQVAASKEKQALIKIATKLNTILKRDYRVLGQDNFHKLQFGPFSEVKKARSVQSEIKSLGYPQCFVTYDMMPKKFYSNK
jgi:rare lipoprotein A